MKSLSVEYVNLSPGDSTEEDSSEYSELITDTLVYSDGADTIYELYDSMMYVTESSWSDTDSSFIYGRMANNRSANFQIENATRSLSREAFPSGSMQLYFGGTAKTINKGLYGINLEGFFKPSSMPNDGTSTYAWQWLVDLGPEVLRFPSGASSKFMHLLHDKNGNPSKGYGYDIDEIAKFYDWTDGYMDNPSYDEIMNDDDIALDGWIGDAAHVNNFIDFRNKYKTQLCETRRYLDDFIELVRQIDEAYPGRPAVKVMLCLNIVSETAAECRAIADYMRSAALNGNHNVNVTGVELGNETYDNFHCQAMGFKYFDVNTLDNFKGNYWDYINGGNYSNVGAEHAHTELFYVLPAAMKATGAHDYITAFKTGGGYNYKIGIVGRPLGNEYAFRLEGGGMEGCDPLENWNENIPDYYTATALGTTKKKFDAVILHTYYEAENWEHIPFDNIAPESPCGIIGDVVYGSPWEFSSVDDRLEDAFSFILGYGTSADNEGNFRDFLTKTAFPSFAYKVSYDKFNTQLNFALSVASGGKELWVTEWNLKDKHAIYLEGTVENAKLEIYSNGFTHGMLLMQWLLKNIKINYDAAYRPNFFTYATMQGFGGGASEDLLTLSDTQERIYLGKTDCPYKEDCESYCDYDDRFDKRNYWVRRTSYYVELMYSEIFKNSLKYLPSVYFLPAGNLNVAPTTFVKTTPAGQEKLYVYYTNINTESQNYKLYPNDLSDLFPGSVAVHFGVAQRNYLQTEQIYSTSGKSSLYDPLLNACYPSNDHPLENIPLLETDISPAITNETNIPDCAVSTFPNDCLTAPANSIGYFVIPLTVEYPFYRMYDSSSEITDIAVYPNPSGDVFYLTPVMEDGSNATQVFNLQLLDMQNQLIFEKQCVTGEAINITTLPTGYYQITVLLENKQQFHKHVIKMK